MDNAAIEEMFEAVGPVSIRRMLAARASITMASSSRWNSATN